MPRLSRGSRSVDSLSPSSVSFPRYTTYTPEELEKTFARYSHIGAGEGVGIALSASPSGGGRTRLIKSHECCVSYPDGTTGLCKYTRGGPTWHVFGFSHQGQTDLPQRPLPTRNCLERLPNTLVAIEAKAAEFAQAAFAEAVRRERDERFKRATSPTGYNRYTPYNKSRGSNGDDTSLLPSPQMSVKRAKELAGKYALCLRLGTGDNQRFLPSINFVYDSLDEANEAWRQHEHRARRVVACLCRYNRQWELPVYNPLHADTQYAALLGPSVTNANESPDESPAEAAEAA